MIDKNGGADFPVEQLLDWKKEHDEWIAQNLNKRRAGVGGDGGTGTIIGDHGVIFGGRGGDGGSSGHGGKGGDGFISGNDGMIIGGDGGSAASSDGRGGKGARGPTERFGFSTDIWGFGRGGSGVNHPEYDRRLDLLVEICEEYKAKFPDDARYVDAGIDRIPIDWINQRLVELDEDWLVVQGTNGNILPTLADLENN